VKEIRSKAQELISKASEIAELLLEHKHTIKQVVKRGLRLNPGEWVKEIYDGIFSIDEFRCPDNCEISNLRKELVLALTALRMKLGFPLYVGKGGGLRCWQFHKSIYKKKFGEDWKKNISWNSYHLQGGAADVFSEYLVPLERLVELAREISEFVEIGVGKDYVHLAVKLDDYHGGERIEWKY